MFLSRLATRSTLLSLIKYYSLLLHLILPLLFRGVTEGIPCIVPLVLRGVIFYLIYSKNT